MPEGRAAISRGRQQEERLQGAVSIQRSRISDPKVRPGTGLVKDSAQVGNLPTGGPYGRALPDRLLEGR